MGNDISHRRYWCRRFRRFERLPAEDKTDDVSDVPTAQGGRFWDSVSPPEKEKPHGAAAGLHSKEQGRKRKEKASCSPLVAQGMGRSSELQQLGDTGDNPPATNPAGKPPTWGRAAGDTEETSRESPVQAAVEVGAAEELPRQGTEGSSSGSQHRASTRVYRPRQCRICKWLENLKAPEEKPKTKPGAVSSQE